MTTGTITIGGDTYGGRLALSEDFETLDRWHAPETHGRWAPGGDGLRAEWLEASPSLFLREPIAGDYLWTIDATRVEPDAEFLRRFAASKHGGSADPAVTYNFNFWLRAAAPDGGDFLRQYPLKLGTGWNGMGDDHWNSLFTTVVRTAGDDWVRLRRSPGYNKVAQAKGIVPLLPYGRTAHFAFAICGGRVRAYCDEQRIYDFADPEPYARGHIGLCVWLCTMRFERMRLYALKP